MYSSIFLMLLHSCISPHMLSRPSTSPPVLPHFSIFRLPQLVCCPSLSQPYIHALSSLMARLLPRPSLQPLLPASLSHSGLSPSLSPALFSLLSLYFLTLSPVSSLSPSIHSYFCTLFHTSSPLSLSHALLSYILRWLSPYRAIRSSPNSHSSALFPSLHTSHSTSSPPASTWQEDILLYYARSGRLPCDIMAALAGPLRMVSRLPRPRPASPCRSTYSLTTLG